MKKPVLFVLALIFEAAIMMVTNSTDRMQPVHAMVTLIVLIFLCLATITCCVGAMKHDRKSRILSRNLLQTQSHRVTKSPIRVGSRIPESAPQQLP